MTDRELMQQCYAVPLHEQLTSVPENSRLVIDDPDGKGALFIPVGRMCHEAAAALRERLAQPQQSHEINADTDAIGMAIHDALVCGTGVVKLWLDGGKMQFDHVPIKDFAVFADELKWRAAHTVKEKMNG